jgi:hypothetical protein
MVVQVTFNVPEGSALSTPWRLLYLGATAEEALETASAYLDRNGAQGKYVLRIVPRM